MKTKTTRLNINNNDGTKSVDEQIWYKKMMQNKEKDITKAKNRKTWRTEQI